MIAYSYIRWSSAQQTSGDSLRRQTELADKYAERHGLSLASTSFQDHGVSAFKGKNAVEGKLGTFLKAIDEQVIKTPCYLLVEALDRLTRNEIADAAHLFLSIIRRDVTIVVLQNEQVFSKETISNDNGISLIIAISMLAQGHAESAKRGKRVKAAWDEKRRKQKDGVIATKAGPAWLKLSDDGKRFIVDEAKANIVRYIFKLALDGNGRSAIAKRLNSEGVPTIGTRQWRDGKGNLGRVTTWTSGNISTYFRHECVFGRWRQSQKSKLGTGEYIDNYYPAIISKEDYDLVKATRKKVRAGGGANQGTSNLFSGLTKCAYCGSAFKYQTGRASNSSVVKYRYLFCSRSLEKAGCSCKKVIYGVLESEVLSYLIHWAHRDLNPAELSKSSNSAKATLEQTLAQKEDELQALIKVITLTKSNPEVLAAKIDETQTAIDKLKNDIKSVDTSFVTDKQIEDSIELFEQLMDGGDIELRKKVQTALRRQLRRIDVAPNIELHPEAFKMFDIKTKPKTPLHMVKLTYVDGSVALFDVIWN